jgi:hypothetical protein
MNPSRKKYIPGIVLTALGVLCHIIVMLIGWLVDGGSDPDIGLGLVMMLGAVLIIAGLVALAIKLPRFWKILPVLVLVLYIGGMGYQWGRREAKSNEIYRQEQLRRHR